MQSEKEVIGVIGSGYVGITTAAILANSGYTVYALDVNQDRLNLLKEGKAFFYEDHLNTLLERAVRAGTLIPTSSYQEAIPKSSIVFSCVGTPDNPDGSSNLSYVISAATSTLEYANDGLIYVQKSTVPVGTGAKIQKTLSQSGKIVAYVSNPEFLREGTALIDSIWPDRVVVGSDDETAADNVMGLYREVVKNREKLATIIGFSRSSIEPEWITTGLNSAELIKVSANAFLALKISFANSIAKLSDRAGADISEVMNAVGADPRIGKAFLNAGRGYGGGCFPKDVSGLISSGLDYGINLKIMEAASEENRSMPGYILEKSLEYLDGKTFEGKKVAVLGLAFKAETSDVRKSPAIDMANLLVSKMGAVVTAYDPQANDEARPYLQSGVVVVDTALEAVSDVDVVIVATNWKDILAIPLEEVANAMLGAIFIDAMNSYSPKLVSDAGLTYVGVGRN